ncbi:hypothetical protein FRC10_003589 [Ceratobasidium sp. 414]|nr:hypothetical protein FRC10_003589 [Ceratobasidium sp. 414]
MAEEPSPMSSPVSISSILGAESLGSDVQSVRSLGANNENTEGVKVFAYGDGDFELCVNGMLFQTHKYLLKRFSGLKRMIEQKATDHQDKLLTLEREHGLEDFRSTLKVLYMSPIEGPLEFDTGTLISALRIATAYDYPALQTFAINNLEKAHLSAIDRIRIAREFGFASWEAPAYVELCEREEPITEQEANVLGMNAFVQVARIREKEQRRKGEKGAQYQKEAGGDGESEVAGLGEPAVAPQAMAGASKAAATGEMKPGVAPGDAMQVDGVNMDDAVKKSRKCYNTLSHELNAEAIFYLFLAQDPNPCFIGFSPAGAIGHCTSSSGALQYKIPGCQCQSPAGVYMYDHNGNGLGTDMAQQCTISPCAAKALEQIQVHQLAQASSIIKLESAVEEIKSGREPPHSTLDADKSSNELTELTLVQAEVREWLGLRECSGQGS